VADIFGPTKSDQTIARIYQWRRIVIVCCGEALIDMLPEHLKDGRGAFVPVPGGAAYNTAVALGRLGEDSGVFSGLSTDMFGQQLIRHLEDSGVSTSLCVRSPNPTTLAFVYLTDGHAQYTFLDENTAGRMLGSSAIVDLPTTIHALHFGGISLIQEPCGSTFEELMKRNQERKVISFDPNIRPGFVVDEPAYRERIRRMIAMSDIIKVSEEDLDWMEPGEQFEHIAHNWIAAGASIVTLTMGGDGARSITKVEDVTVTSKQVQVVDTVGAGDTFNAGFLASLRLSGILSKEGLPSIDHQILRGALEYGTRAAAHTVSQAGANPPRKDQM